MQPTDAMPSTAMTSDAELVAACLDGDREAFGRIVERYQRLLCSLAYSATGRLSESEDVAQEAFITAWQQLRDLREPEKLRPWLCGILRHKVGRLRRSARREPVRQADSLEVAGEVPSSEEPAPNRAMKKEEQEILWHALEQVPGLYREPLVLYYREHRSVEHVACALDLTEDAVKQRLVRGRRMLQERVLAFVEGALVRTTPGAAFTSGVMASLAAIAPPAKAAAAGTVAAHAGMTAKSAGIAAMLASISGVVSTVLTVRANLDQARTPRERRAAVRIALVLFGLCAVLVAAVFGLRMGAMHWWDSREVFAIASQVAVLAFVVAWPVVVVRMLRDMRELRTAERRRQPEHFRSPADQIGSKAGEFRSKASLFGVPLVHIRFASAEADSRPVFGWIAGGDRACGILFAWGAWAVGFISVGAVSVGVFSLGALGVGVIGLGAVGVGLLAAGAMSIGVDAWGSLSALGWDTAHSLGFGIARTAAEAPVAFAQHANDPVAREILANPQADLHEMIFFVVVSILAIAPVAAYAAAVRRRLGRRKPEAEGGGS